MSRIMCLAAQAIFINDIVAKWWFYVGYMCILETRSCEPAHISPTPRFPFLNASHIHKLNLKAISAEQFLRPLASTLQSAIVAQDFHILTSLSHTSPLDVRPGSWLSSLRTHVLSPPSQGPRTSCSELLDTEHGDESSS